MHSLFFSAFSTGKTLKCMSYIHITCGSGWFIKMSFLAEVSTVYFLSGISQRPLGKLRILCHRL